MYMALGNIVMGDNHHIPGGIDIKFNAPLDKICRTASERFWKRN